MVGRSQGRSQREIPDIIGQCNSIPAIETTLVESVRCHGVSFAKWAR